jgi:hypothetical protein
MHREPLLKNSLNKCRKRHAPRCTLSTATLLLAKEYRSGAEVHIIHSHPEEFTPPRSRVGGQANHWVQKRLSAVTPDMFQQLIDFGPLKKQALPELADLNCGEPTTADLTLDVRSRLKRWLRICAYGSGCSGWLFRPGRGATLPKEPNHAKRHFLQPLWVRGAGCRPFPTSAWTRAALPPLPIIDALRSHGQ